MKAIIKAMWNGKIIAQSNETIVVEKNHYFPPDSVNREYLKESSKTSACPWKGEAHYYSLSVDGKENSNAAWYYPQPKEAVKEIKDYVAFWKEVEVSE